MDTIFDQVQAAIQAGYDPTWSYDSGLAAINLGVSTKTLHRLDKIGAVRAFSIPSQFPGKVTWRYRQEDLDNFVLRHSNRKRYWDPEEDAELPVRVVARLLNVTTETVYVLKSRGKLSDYQPETIRDYLQRTKTKSSRLTMRHTPLRDAFHETNRVNRMFLSRPHRHFSDFTTTRQLAPSGCGDGWLRYCFFNAAVQLRMTVIGVLFASGLEFAGSGLGIRNRWLSAETSNVFQLPASGIEQNMRC
jgi:hypothetical protein